MQSYLAHLKHPLSQPPVAPPVHTPEHTNVFHIRNTQTISVTSSGLMIYFTPGNLSSAPINLRSWDSTQSYSTAVSSTTYDNGQYPSWPTISRGNRIVAAAMALTYVGKADDLEGYMLAGSVNVRSHSATIPYDDLPNKEDEMHYIENRQRLIGPGTISVNYEPLDVTQFQYSNDVSGTQSDIRAFHGIIFINGLSTTRKYRLETAITIEYLPTPDVKVMNAGPSSYRNPQATFSPQDVLMAIKTYEDTTDKLALRQLVQSMGLNPRDIDTLINTVGIKEALYKLRNP